MESSVFINYLKSKEVCSQLAKDKGEAISVHYSARLPLFLWQQVAAVHNL